MVLFYNVGVVLFIYCRSGIVLHIQCCNVYTSSKWCGFYKVGVLLFIQRRRGGFTQSVLYWLCSFILFIHRRNSVVFTPSVMYCLYTVKVVWFYTVSVVLFKQRRRGGVVLFIQRRRGGVVFLYTVGVVWFLFSMSGLCPWITFF